MKQTVSFAQLREVLESATHILPEGHADQLMRMVNGAVNAPVNEHLFSACIYCTAMVGIDLTDHTARWRTADGGAECPRTSGTCVVCDGPTTRTGNHHPAYAEMVEFARWHNGAADVRPVDEDMTAYPTTGDMHPAEVTSASVTVAGVTVRPAIGVDGRIRVSIDVAHSEMPRALADHYGNVPMVIEVGGELIEDTPPQITSVCGGCGSRTSDDDESPADRDPSYVVPMFA